MGFKDDKQNNKKGRVDGLHKSRLSLASMAASKGIAFCRIAEPTRCSTFNTTAPYLKITPEGIKDAYTAWFDENDEK